MEVVIRHVSILTLLTLSHGAIFSTDFETKLISYIEASMKCHNVPGMTLSVVKECRNYSEIMEHINSNINTLFGVVFQIQYLNDESQWITLSENEEDIKDTFRCSRTVEGDEVWSHGFGKEDLFSGKVVDSDSRFNIGSITKSFTATLLGILLSEKGMNWTAKVTDILGPTYEFVDPYRTKELTLRDLLSHRTGLARLDFGGLGAGIAKSVSRTEFCRRMKYLPEELPIRDGYIYNNFMFMMAGHAAEALGQDTWENLVTTKIFQPLGMNSTKFMLTPSDILDKDTARPYVYVDDHFENGTLDLYELHPMEPAGAIMSTATDMSKWMEFHLSLGKTESGVQLLDQKLVRDIHTVTTAISSQNGMTKPLFPVDDITSGYCYGMISSEYRGYKKIWHDGGLGAYISLMWTFPDLNIGIFGSVNGPGFGFTPSDHLDVTFYYITDHLIGLQTWLNESTACSFPEPWVKRPMPEDKSETPVIVKNLAELTGSYGNSLFPDVQVYSNATVLHLDSNRIHGILRPSSEKDRFLFELISPIEYALLDNNHTHYSANVTFNRDSATQAVNAVTLKLEVDLKYDRKPDPQIIG